MVYLMVDSGVELDISISNALSKNPLFTENRVSLTNPSILSLLIRPGVGFRKYPMARSA